MAKITSQDGTTIFLSRHIIGVRVHYWPQLREGDPDVSYDVMVQHVHGEAVGGRYTTLERAAEVRDELADAIDADTPYGVPET